MKPSHPLFRRSRLRAIAVALTFAVALAGTCARGDFVFDWNDALIGLSTNAVHPPPPHLEVRVYAMAHLAMEEGMAEAARGAIAGEDHAVAQRAAAATAAQVVLTELLPARAEPFTALAKRQLAALPEGAAKTRGILAGRAAAALVGSKREDDGWLRLAVLNPPAGPAPDGSRQAAELVLARGAAPPSPWLQVTPFLLKNAAHFDALPPYTVSHEGQLLVDSTLRNARVFAGVDRAAAAAALELHWSGRPVVTWNRLARSAAARKPLDLAGEARLLAVLNLALADATLSALHWRHALGTWRTWTVSGWSKLEGMYPLAGDEVALAQTDQGTELVRREMHTRLLPPIPNHPALAATLAGAAQAAINGCLRDERSPVVLPWADGGRSAMDPTAPRVCASVTAAAREGAFVASFDGRHSRESCVAGYRLGDDIGRFVVSRVNRRR